MTKRKVIVFVEKQIQITFKMLILKGNITAAVIHFFHILPTKKFPCYSSNEACLKDYGKVKCLRLNR